MSKRRSHSPEFKAQVVLEALRGEATLAAVAANHRLHPVQVCQWKQQATKQLPETFRQAKGEATSKNHEELTVKLARLEQTNTNLATEIDWLKKKFCSYDQAILRSLLEPDHPLISLRRQCELLGVTRSSYYYQPTRFTQKNRGIVHRIDAFCAENPAISSRKLLTQLQATGMSICVNHLHRLLCRLGFAPFERRLIKMSAGRLETTPPLPFRMESTTNYGEQWILDIAYWPSSKTDLFAALLVDGHSNSCLAWGLSDHPSSALTTGVLTVALDNHPAPFILHSETFLTFLSPPLLRRLRQEGICLVGPLWLNSLEGAGRNTPLAQIWMEIKQQARVLRSKHPQAQEDWILPTAIIQRTTPGAKNSICGKALSWSGGDLALVPGASINDPATGPQHNCGETRRFPTSSTSPSTEKSHGSKILRITCQGTAQMPPAADPQMKYITWDWEMALR
ncbi:MAG: transposase [Cyanobacteriota bacterium]